MSQISCGPNDLLEQKQKPSLYIFFVCNEFLIKTFSISIFGMCKLKGLVNGFPMLFIMNIAEILQNGYIKMLENLILTGNIKSYMLVLYGSSLYIHCRHRKVFKR